MKKKEIKRSDNQYDHLSSRYFVKSTPELDEVAYRAHDLFNRALYDLRQSLFNHGDIYSYQDLNNLFKGRYDERETMLYHALGYVQSAQQTLKEVATVWDACFKALDAYKANPNKFTGRPRLVNYLHKNERHTFFVTNQNARLKNGYISIKKLNFKLKVDPKIKSIQRLAFKPVHGGYEVFIQYKTNKSIAYKPDNGIYIGIDPGVDNAFTCVCNKAVQPLIVNGHSIKSVNQYYHKEKARLQSLQAQYHQLEYTLKNGMVVYKQTNQMSKLNTIRNRKVLDFAHKASKRIVEYALNCGANTIVIGYNKGWKRSSNMGKRNNQNFLGIPHKMFVDMITYKANFEGITVIKTNESYTSQTSFLDGEKPIWQNGNKSRKLQGKSPIYRRFRRGLFKSNKGILINADVNAAFQIIKKVFPNAMFADGIEGVVSRPSKCSILI